MNSTPRLVAKHRLMFAAMTSVLLGISLVFNHLCYSRSLLLGSWWNCWVCLTAPWYHRVATALWPLRTLRQHAIFVAGYIGLAIAVLIFWIIAPSIALGAFLIYSALYFSDDWRAEVGLWQSLPLGISVIALPALVFQSDVAVLFGFLTAEPTATLFAALLHKTAIVAIIALAFCLAVDLRATPWVMVEYALLVATALVTPLLIYFVVYFCALHSPPIAC